MEASERRCGMRRWQWKNIARQTMSEVYAFVTQAKKRVFVIGAAALDITGAPQSVSRLRDSNIGRIRLAVGGVGKNIARSLTRYDMDVSLVTAIGSDFWADMIETDCKKWGIDLSHALRCEGASGTYLSVLDEDGDLLVGVNDMQALNALTPAALSPLLPALNRADMCVLDANLPAETLAYLTNSLTSPIFYEPVSCAKAKRIGDKLGKCFAIKPNRFEAAELSGRSCDTARGIYRAGEWFLNQGVQRVFISLAAEGVYWADPNGCGLIPAESVRVVDTTGAGDAMCAAIIDGCINGLSAAECAIYGNHMSALACAKEGN